jgi:23S rRNA (uracil1939-C5)-methyltransferase
MASIRELHLDGLAHGGLAVGRAEDGRVVFVKEGCPGDVVDAEVTADHGRYLEADIARVVTASPDRRTPPCPYFGRCGGCQWQHVSYAAQAEAKCVQVADSLTRIGRLEGFEVDPTVSGPSPYGYRNRLELRVARAPDGSPLIGMSTGGTDEIVPIEACLLLPERARRTPRAIAGALRYLGGRTPLEIDRVAIRVAARTRDLEVDLWGPPGPFPRQAVARTLADAVKTTCVTRVLAKGDARERADLKVEVLSGRGFWHERLGGYDYRVSAPSFFQVNTVLAETLVGMVLERLDADGSDRVLDLYAGTGTFTLPLAEAAAEVVAIEGAGSAVRDLRANIESAGVSADVMPGDAARALADAGVFDLAVVDPPRSGLPGPVTGRLVATGARRICYVSCDTATLGRDAKALTEAGYRLTSATPVDLFPQTWHVESVALFERLEPHA